MAKSELPTGSTNDKGQKLLPATQAPGQPGEPDRRWQNCGGSDADLGTPLVSDADANAARATAIIDRFTFAADEEYRTGTDTEFEGWYEPVEAPSGNTIWEDDEIVGIDPALIVRLSEGDTGGTVISFNNLVPGGIRVNHEGFLVLDRPLTTDSEQYWFGQSPDERATDYLLDAVDRSLHPETRAYAAREAIESLDFEWAGYSELNADEYLEFDELVEDDAKLIAAVDGLIDDGMTAEDPSRFGAAVSERLWANHLTARADLIWDADDSEEEADVARAGVRQMTDINLLANMVTPDTEDFMVLGALENPIATPVIVDRAARHTSLDVRRAAALHPLVAKKTLLRLRAESVNNAEALDGYGAPSVTVSELVKSIKRQEAAVNRDLIAVVDQVLAQQRRTGE